MKRKTLAQVQAIVSNVEFMDRTFHVTEREGGFLLQLEYLERDVLPASWPSSGRASGT